MVKISAALITLAIGFLFLIGILVVQKIKNPQSIYKFSSAMAFSVILGLILFDIIPEIWENFTDFNISQKIIHIFAYTLIGIIVLKLLDVLVPVHTHHHEEHEKNVKEHNNHLFHIGFITSIALIIHNIIEGMAIYSISIISLKTGTIMALGVALHNIPIGIEISLALKMSNKNKLKQKLTYFLLAISTFIGSLFMILFNNISSIIIAVLMCITLGMLIYISLFELGGEVKNNLTYKETIGGLITGMVLMIITLFI